MNEEKFFSKVNITLKQSEKYNKSMLIIIINLICTFLIITGNIAFTEIKDAIKLVENITEKTWNEIMKIWKEC